MKTNPARCFGRAWLALGVEIERLEGGGFNVWPPATLDESDDPYAGDHFVHNWHEALEHVQSYAALNHR